MLKSPKTNKWAEGLIERTWSMLDEIELKAICNEIVSHRSKINSVSEKKLFPFYIMFWYHDFLAH